MTDTVKTGTGTGTGTEAAAAESTPFQAVEAIYFNMQDKLNDMLAACKTKAERADILAKFVAARHNYDDCMNAAFQGNDAALATLVAQASKSAAEIKAIDTQLGNIAKVITIVTTAVTDGEKIVKKIIAL